MKLLQALRQLMRRLLRRGPAEPQDPYARVRGLFVADLAAAAPQSLWKSLPRRSRPMRLAAGGLHMSS